MIFSELLPNLYAKQTTPKHRHYTPSLFFLSCFLKGQISLFPTISLRVFSLSHFSLPNLHHYPLIIIQKNDSLPITMNDPTTPISNQCSFTNYQYADSFYPDMSYSANNPMKMTPQQNEFFDLDEECPATPGTATMTKACTEMMFDFVGLLNSSADDTSPSSQSMDASEDQPTSSTPQNPPPTVQVHSNPVVLALPPKKSQSKKLSIRTVPSSCAQAAASSTQNGGASAPIHPTPAATSLSPSITPSCGQFRKESDYGRPQLGGTQQHTTSSSSHLTSPVIQQQQQQQQRRSPSSTCAGVKSLCSVPLRSASSRRSAHSRHLSSGTVEGAIGKSPYVRPVDHSCVTSQAVCKILNGALTKRDELIKHRSCGTPPSATSSQVSSMFSRFGHTYSYHHYSDQSLDEGLSSAMMMLVMSGTSTSLPTSPIGTSNHHHHHAGNNNSNHTSGNNSRKNILANRRAAAMARRSMSLSVVTCQHSIDV